MAVLRRLASALVLLCMLGGASAAQGPAEYQVKAVFLFNFTQFVEWPRGSFADARAPFVIGVLGRDPFGQALDDAVKGELVDGRPLVIERYRSSAELRPCQILFIDRSASAELDRTLDAVGHTGTLTVSDFEAPSQRDVIIRFLTENQKIRLRINVGSAHEAGLTISSKLLRPAQVVGSAGTG